ncbi:hypothetical protein M9H77_34599 [Catharanthus roseus]|uniref:Uncharacterized protein n=1 Tax=Catharanthus roseus TaxID=4058 RepID=A0ACB9ZMI8_CATRO|nr:hypothetical protein M9H77_34599 [Catharanthus roseus]
MMGQLFPFCYLQAIFNEFCKMLDPGKPSFTLKKGKPSIHVCGFYLLISWTITGWGKTTTTCTKYVYYHQKKGWKLALVCVDIFRAGAFDQLKQNTIKAKIPFHGRYFPQCGKFLILYAPPVIFQISDSLIWMFQKPDIVIFIMDSSIGQAAFDQAQTFKQSIADGAVIVTKMDGHAKGGAALSA